MELRDKDREYYRLCCIVLLLTTNDKDIFARAYKEVTDDGGAGVWYYIETKKS